MPSPPSVILIMLYGIPRVDTPIDHNYATYLSWVLGDPDDDGKAPIYVGGGATDPSRPRRTEALTAALILRVLKVDVERLYVKPEGRDAREVLEHMAKVFRSEATTVRIYCAYSHQDLVRFLAGKILVGREVEVVPLPFPVDQGMATGMAMRALRYPRTLLGKAAWYHEQFDAPRWLIDLGWRPELIREFEWWLRLRHMRKHAMFPERVSSS